MKLDDLKIVHADYKNHIEEWNLYGLAYEGGMRFIKYCLKHNSRESYANWHVRQDEGSNFNYASSIIDMMNFYLTEKQPVRYLSGLDNDPLWNMFLQDCDYRSTNYDVFINEAQKYASVYGHVGILVNKTSVIFDTKQHEIDNESYPYLTVYTPPNILDWNFENNDVGRPILKYLKLREREDRYLLYFEHHWELYQIDERNEVKLAGSGANSLGVIPFVWNFNIRNISNPMIGISDLKEIAPIVSSICKNISSGDEIIKYAGFPMMRLPKDREGAVGGSGGDILVAPDGVLEFDPELGEKGKPDWLETKVLEPIDAILAWTDRKADEIFRLAHLSGVHGQRKSNNEVSSGLAIRYEGNQLNSLLNKKANQMNETELLIIKYWLMWQNQSNLFDKVRIIRKREFATDDLSVSLDVNLKAIASVGSNLFSQKVKEKIVHQTLPDLTDDEIDKIIKEVIQNNEKMNAEMGVGGIDENGDDKKEDSKNPDMVKEKLIQAMNAGDKSFFKQNQKVPTASTILNRQKK
jgi:hypothetical protein